MEDKRSPPQLQAGVRAAKKWLRENGFMMSGDEAPDRIAEMFEAMKIDAEFVSEVRMQIVTDETFASSKMRGAMYEAHDWKKAAPGSRTIILFVPRRLRVDAPHFLPLFESYIEY